MNEIKRSIKLNSSFPYEEFVDPFAIQKITDSNGFINGQWKSDTQLRGFQEGVKKFVLPVDISKFNIMVLTEVQAGQVVKSHSHKDEPIFRFIISGNLLLNGTPYEAGDWVIVPTGMPYEITTEGGYTTMAPYCMSCEQNG